QFTLNYELPFSKFPFLQFVKSTYNYTGDYSWTRSSDAFSSIDYNGITYDLGNKIQNANTHRLNTTLSMDKLYKYVGLIPSSDKAKAKPKPTIKPKPGEKIERNKQLTDKERNEMEDQEGSAVVDALIRVITGVKNMNVTYEETNGTVLPGFTQGLGFFGSTKPSVGFVFGDQSDIRYEAAKRGWLTYYPEFNQAYMEMNTKRLNFTADYKPFKNFTIDFTARKQESFNLSEQYDVSDGIYHSRAPYEYGYFEISTNMINTSFLRSDVNGSEAFERFKENRLAVANRLATQRGIDITDPNNLDQYGYPIGYGRTSQEVLAPAFLAAYQGRDVNKVSNGFFRNVPIPGWRLR